MLLFRSILAQDQITPGGNGQIVAVFDAVAVIGFDEQFELPWRQCLAVMRLMVTGTVTPDFAAASRRSRASRPQRI